MAYPIELRQKAIEYYRQCKNASQVCRVYGISDKTLSSWLRLYEQTGSLAHQVKGGNATKIDRQQLSDYLEQYPDAYQHEIAEHLGCSTPNVNYLLKVMGITRKKRPPHTKNKSPNK